MSHASELHDIDDAYQAQLDKDEGDPPGFVLTALCMWTGDQSSGSGQDRPVQHRHINVHVLAQGKGSARRLLGSPPEPRSLPNLEDLPNGSRSTPGPNSYSERLATLLLHFNQRCSLSPESPLTATVAAQGRGVGHRLAGRFLATALITRYPMFHLPTRLSLVIIQDERSGRCWESGRVLSLSQSMEDPVENSQAAIFLLDVLSECGSLIAATLSALVRTELLKARRGGSYPSLITISLDKQWISATAALLQRRDGEETGTASVSSCLETEARTPPEPGCNELAWRAVSLCTDEKAEALKRSATFCASCSLCRQLLCPHPRELLKSCQWCRGAALYADITADFCQAKSQQIK
ncbi:hypothetical protein EYF80_009349 [Liparis tanakae]|uniref:Uncharacterized protein n=1 Tax=Liparis tanakae TaxID=230148 RepID=A0A4Z2IQY4_9TELE|nr:hypothetical protein EYF80_009349 [Liparis tanakae]